MYYPYFRGRRVELLALRDVVSKLVVKKRVCPIIEPVMAKTGDLKTFLDSAKGQHPHIILTNPAVGELMGQSAAIEALIAPYLATPGNELFPGFIVGPTTTMAEVNAFLTTHKKHQTAFVFSRPNPALPGLAAKIQAATIPPILVFIKGKVSPSFILSFGALRKVLVRSGFIAQDKNALYPQLDFYSDLHRTYAAAGFHGFGDFTIVEDVYNPGGGPAHAVAIHLTELNAKGEIDANHFVSNRTTGTVDTAGKFMEALTKLVAHVRAHPRSFTYSLACGEFRTLHTTQHFPGLATVKRLSIRHHLELMESIV
jgi:hypothetical protein